MSGRMQTYGSGSGERHLYVVEARNSCHAVKPVLKIGAYELVDQWQRIKFPEGPVGIPFHRDYLNAQSRELGLMQYATAIALARWLLALPDKLSFGMFPALGTEVRIVKVKMIYSYSTEEIGVGPTISNERDNGDLKWVTR